MRERGHPDFLDVLSLWLRERYHLDVRAALAVVPDTEETGGCETCWETVKIVRILYEDNAGNRHTVTKSVSYPELMKKLEKIADRETRRPGRERMLDALKEALRGGPFMAYRIVAPYIRYKGADGIERIARREEIVTYLPQEAIESLVREGHAWPVCLSEEPECDCSWCVLVAFDEEDPGWLPFVGWPNPFRHEVKP